MTTKILTEQSNPLSENIDLMSGVEIAELINQEDRHVAIAISSQVKKIGQAIELIAQSFAQGGRLGYFGSGTSGRLGVLDASECPPTYGVSPKLVEGFISGGDKALRTAVENAEDSAELALQDLQIFAPSKNDIVVGISASGNAAYTNTILNEAQKLGTKTIAICTNPNASLKAHADIFICPEVGPEVISGSSRMKSGSAQKMILNMLTTGAMIRTGKTYKNYMIDLQITNQKLHQRACQIISEISKVSITEAPKYLAQSHNNVKIACLMAAKNIDYEAAEQLLRQNHGILRRTL